MAELLLHVALATSAEEARPTRSEWPENLLSRSPSVRSPRTPAGQHGVFDQTRDVPVGQALGADLAADDAPEYRPDRNPCKLEPRLERGDGAGGVARAAADFDLPPAGLSPQRQQQTVVEKFDPAA